MGSLFSICYSWNYIDPFSIAKDSVYKEVLENCPHGWRTLPFFSQRGVQMLRAKNWQGIKTLDMLKKEDIYWINLPNDCVTKYIDFSNVPIGAFTACCYCGIQLNIVGRNISGSSLLRIQNYDYEFFWLACSIRCATAITRHTKPPCVTYFSS